MMPALDRLLARLRAAFRKPVLDADFEAELAHHLEMRTGENIQAGMDPEEARREARLALGGVEQTRELHREARGLPWLEQLGRDLRFSVRLFRREPGFTVVALLILAIGIGLNTTVFSLVNTVLLRPLPYSEAERLVWITNGNPANPENRDLSNIASRIDTWEGLQETTRTLERIEVYDPFSVRHTFRLTGNNADPETVLAVQVSPGLFPMLGLRPLHGRFLRPEDATPDAPPRTVLSHQLWQRRYDSNPGIVGQTIEIDHRAVEVVGVMPQSDPFSTVFFPAVRVDLFSSVVNERSRNWGNTVSLIGRMKPGTTHAEVAADLNLSIDQLKQQYPDRNNYYFANVTPLHDWVAGGLKQPLLFLWIAAGLVLAIVGFNLGGLLLARGAGRAKELALRTALGAGRLRIARQLLTECFALVAMGAVLGGLVSWGFIRLLSIRTAVEIPLLQNVRLDAAALGFTFLICLITALICGVAPAWKLSFGGDVQNALKEEGRGSSGGRNQSRTRSTLVILEVALACVLAISAGLMVRSFLNLLKVDLGFESENLIAVRIDPVIDDGWEAYVNYLEATLDRVRALPGVEAAGLTDCVPVERDRGWGLYPVVADNPDDQDWDGAHVRIVSPGLLGALGTRLIAGRDFTRFDASDSPPVIVINQSLAKRFWPGEDALGRQVNVNGNVVTTVIGVVGDVRHSGPELPSGNEFYLPLRQQPSGSWDLLVRTPLPVSTLTADLRNALREIDPTLPLTKVRPMTTLIDRTLSSRRLMVFLIGGFAAIALGLAALGLYGLISYTVTQRTKEIGIRMALGADSATVQRQVVGDTMKLALAGLALGVAGTIAAGRFMQSMLYGVSAGDPQTYIVMILGALACAFVAGYIPARRASRVDPMHALRTD